LIDLGCVLRRFDVWFASFVSSFFIWGLESDGVCVRSENIVFFHYYSYAFAIFFSFELNFVDVCQV